VLSGNRRGSSCRHFYPVGFGEPFLFPYFFYLRGLFGPRPTSSCLQVLTALFRRGKTGLAVKFSFGVPTLANGTGILAINKEFK